MSPDSLTKQTKTTYQNTKSTVGAGVKTMLHDPQITIYAYLAVAFLWVTSPLVTHYVIDTWQSVERPVAGLGAVNHAPHSLLAHIGLVAFSGFYAIFISSYFTCAVSASVWAKLEGRPTTPLFGLGQVGRRFLRVTLFSLLAVFFFPLAVFAQRKKLPRGIIDVVGSSFSLSMVQMAPAVMQSNASFFNTIKGAIETLGKAWHESLFIRLVTFVGVLALGGVSFLIKLSQNWLFHGETARVAGWFSSILLGVGVFITVRVLSTVLTTTLYHKLSHKQS